MTKTKQTTKQKTKIQKTVTFEERYHGPLITDGVSLGHLSLCSWLSFFFSIFMVIFGVYNDRIGFFKFLFCFCLLVNSFSILLSWMKSIVYRFKSFTYSLIAVNLATLSLNLDSMGLLLFIGSGVTHPKIYSWPSALYVFFILLLFLLSCGVYAWHYLPKNQGKVWEINQWKTYGVKGGGKKRELSNNFWIIFGAVLIVPPLLTGYIENAFGLFLGVLFTLTLPAVIVDAVYAAIYIRKHPDDDVL